LVVRPAPSDTAFHSVHGPEIVESWKANIPAGRLGRPEEVAKVIAFLAGEDAVYLVGEVVQVNGGQMMD
jgi:NAD(P)-dependent dehydrogenase (short-subunit alcohol dehydrogenase family)